jgi:hypothetical protein
MKRFTESELKKYLQLRVEKIIISEGLSKKQNNPILEFESSKKETISESDSIQIEDVKLLAEEVKRMKELVDFRSPLLKNKHNEE